MSSNPFRRSKAIPPPSQPASSSLDEDYDAIRQPSTPPKRSKPKRVQIQTPPHSPELQFIPEDGNRRLSASAGRTNSPPPPPTTQIGADNELDLSAPGDSDLAQAQINAGRNSIGLDPFPSAPPPSSSVRAPYNPFARTLATSEASFGIPPEQAEEQGELASEKFRPSGRPAIDVDMFTSILLKGTAPPPSMAVGVSAPLLSRLQEDKSGTDVSSVPLFGSGADARSESPRTSFDDYDTASDEEEDDGNEKTSLMGPNRPQEIAPPAPPKPKGRGPQTVSFADFEQSIPSTYLSSGPQTPPINPILRTPSRSPSDLNKPLPPPPAARSMSFENGPASSHRRPKSYTSSSRESLSQPKKVPPPPPASRRQATLPTRPRSATQDSITTTTTTTAGGGGGVEEVNFFPDPSSSNTSSEDLSTKGVSAFAQPPPPPPSRKSHAPTPPPPRNSLPRTSSTNSARNSSDLGTRPTLQSQPPPPVPPQRRLATGGSSSEFLNKRDSIDGRPPSVVRVASSHPQPQQQQQQQHDSEEADQLAEQSRDLLADIAAFQREIDELRLKAGKT